MPYSDGSFGKSVGELAAELADLTTDLVAAGATQDSSGKITALPSGGASTLSGLLTTSTDAGAHKITNLVDPGSAQDAATKNYVDTTGVQTVTAADGSAVIGGTSTAPTVKTGTLDAIASARPPAADWSNNSHKITSVADPTNAQDAATKNYVDQHGTFINAAAYGAVADAYYSDGVATSASATFTSATANFTVADQGKTIVILRAGASSLQDLHTTISSVTNSTTVQLSNNALRSQSACRFYISRSGDQTSAIQSAINAAASAGGGTVLLPGAGYLVTTLTLGNRVWLRGTGMAATMVHQLANTNAPVIQNDYTNNNNGFFTGVIDLKVDGNRARQSDITTTLSAGYTAGGTTLSLTSVTGFLPAGMVTIGTNRLYYTSISGSVLQGVTGGYEGSTDANASIGATVTQHAAGGIYFSTQPPTSQGTTTEDFDSHHLVQNVWVKNVKGDGCQNHGQSEVRWHNVWVEYADEISFRPSFDTWMSNCTSDKSGRHGFYIRSSEGKFTNCKAFYAGNVTASDGHGFFLEGPPSAEEGTKILSACGAQDCQGAGLYTRNAQRVIAQFTASSNSRQGVGTWAGVHLTSNGAPGTSNCIIEAVTTERNQNGNNQTSALFMDATCNANKVRITHGASAGATISTAVSSSANLTGGNDISINGMGGTVTPAYAATYTPDPYVATYHRVGNLTAGITIAAPSNSHVGCPLTIILRQDATGSRTITWNATYINTPTTVTAANGVTVGRFIYDGTNWVGI